jgi:dihydroorotate dehydrogenase (NAD+) catalytic subunit
MSPDDSARKPQSTGDNLAIKLGRLTLRSPILVASGTFGYAREMERIVDFSKLGAILPKTVTRAPRPGNEPARTVETACGLLNSIGLDNDGIEAFVEHHLPYLSGLPTAIIVSIAGKTHDEFVEMTERLEEAVSRDQTWSRGSAEQDGGRVGGAPGAGLLPAKGVAAIELNISCPNVSGGVDFGADAGMCERVVAACREVTRLPIIAKLTPNVTSIATIAKAAEAGGADAISLINTVLGMAIDWRKRRPMLGNVVGGLSGPAIKPIALRCVYQAAQAVKTPLIGIGGIATIDDVMEFFVAGASAVQVGTANYYDPTVSMKLVDALPGALREAGVSRVSEIVGTLNVG